MRGERERERTDGTHRASGTARREINVNLLGAWPTVSHVSTVLGTPVSHAGTVRAPPVSHASTVLATPVSHVSVPATPGSPCLFLLCPELQPRLHPCPMSVPDMAEHAEEDRSPMFFSSSLTSDCRYLARA
eukprot:3730477-Rhodomonas_salina.1